MTHDVIEALRNEIRKHNRLYYVEDSPIISDLEYDNLYRELVRLEFENPSLITKDSPTQLVGDISKKILDSGNLVTHVNPMLSLDNVFDMNDIERFVKRVCGAVDGVPEFLLEPKFDGLAVKLFYKSGRLVMASTRGNGHVGENIFNNLVRVGGIPKLINVDIEYLEVIGEVVMSQESLVKINEERISRGEKPLSNTRNGAAGLLRQKVENITEVREDLQFIAFNMSNPEKFDLEYQSSITEKLTNLGFVTPINTTSFDLAYMMVYSRILQENKDKIVPFDIDGMVIKVNSLKAQAKLGVGTKTPKHSVAYKFYQEEVETILTDVSWSIGKFGTLTPIAHFNSIEIGGVNISKASLHNFKLIEEADLGIGDLVYVIRAGEVIPKIVDNIKTDSSRPILPPTLCPHCNSLVLKEEGGFEYYCTNHTNCKGQLLERMKHFVSRDCFDIKGLGESILDELIRKGIIKDQADILKLTRDDLKLLNIFGDKSIEKLLSSIERANTDVPAHTFYYGLIIDSIGRSLTKKIGEVFPQPSTHQFLFPEQLYEKVKFNKKNKELYEKWISIKENVELYNKLLSVTNIIKE